MAVDTIPNTPPTAAVHQRTEAANRYREQRAQDTTDRQATGKQQQAQEVVQARSDRNADNRKAESSDRPSDSRVDVRA
jgi:hypothetical protein